MVKQVAVLMGAGRIGVAIARRGGTTASYHYGDLQYLKATH